MKLEHLDMSDEHGQIIRLYDFDTAGAGLFRRHILQLAGGSRRVVRLDELNFVECVLTSETWTQVAGLIEPFCERAEPGTWQDLVGEVDGVRWILSVDGGW